MNQQELEKLKEIRDALNKTIQDAEAAMPFQSQLGKTFQEKLSEKLEKKNALSIEKIF